VKKNRIEKITARLKETLNPEQLEIIDEGHLHKGHQGSRDGKGHYRLNIVSNQFVNLSPICIHRMVFDALDELMKTDIHALSINASTPQTKTESTIKDLK
tara:strand:+ start:434 stop:733 length:300 start_codon:yes stop_codon:yes gene_type:complete